MMNRLPALTFALALAAWAAPMASPADARPRSAAPSTVCSQQVGAFRFALNEEQRALTIHPSTYATILAELGPIADACRAGDEAAAGKMLRALKNRWRFW